jgi:hypothetical protein
MLAERSCFCVEMVKQRVRKNLHVPKFNNEVGKFNSNTGYHFLFRFLWFERFSPQRPAVGGVLWDPVFWDSPETLGF